LRYLGALALARCKVMVVALGNMKGRRQWRLMVLPLFI